MIRVLGRPHVDGSGGPTAQSDKLDRLLSALAAQPNEFIAAETLIDGLWPAGPPQSARSSFRNLCTQLRRSIEPLSDVNLVLDQTNESRYKLEATPAMVDHLLFTSLVIEAEQLGHDGSSEAAAAKLEDAIDLWRGPAFEGVDLARVAAVREQLEGLRITAYELLGQAYYNQGRYDRAITLLGPVHLAKPSRERLASVLARALYRAGRSVDALGVLRATASWLGEIGLDPNAELRELEHAILAHDNALSGRIERTEHKDERRGPFIGRISLVREILDSDGEPDCPTWVITANAGLGKSRLLAELAAAVVDHRTHIVAARPADDYPTPLATLDQVIPAVCNHLVDGEEIHAAYRDLRRDDTSALSNPEVRDELNAIVGALSRSELRRFDRLIVAVDDAHCIDEVSLVALRSWARADRSTPSFLFLARPAPPRSGWGGLLAELSAIPNSKSRSLAPLTAGDIADWLRTADQPSPIAPGSLAPVLLERTGGNPYYLRHLIGRLRKTDDPVRFLKTLQGPSLPGDVAHGIQSRLQELPRALQRFLAIAAVQGETFALDDIADIASNQADGAQWIPDSAATAGVVIGPSLDGRYRFDHDLTRAAAMETLDEAELRSLNAQLFRRALQRPDDALVIAHYAAAGVPVIDVTVALEWIELAARRLVTEQSYSAAAALFQTCIDLSLQHGSPDADRDWRYRLGRARCMQHVGLREDALCELDAIVTQAVAAGQSLLAGEAALVAAEFGEFVSLDDPVHALLKRALDAQPLDGELRPQLKFELGVKASLRPPRVPAATAAEFEPQNLHLAIEWLHRASGDTDPHGRLELIHRTLEIHPDADARWLADLKLFEFAALAEIGDFGSAWGVLAEIEQEVGGQNRPFQEWLTKIARVDRFQLAGYFAAASELTRSAAQFGFEHQVGDAAEGYAANYLITAILDGCLKDAAQELKLDAHDDDPKLLATTALLSAAEGQTAVASDRLTRALDIIENAHTFTLTPLVLAMASEATVWLNDPVSAARLIPLLEPYSGLFLRIGLGAGTIGPADFHLGQLHLLLGHEDRAAALFESAAELSEACRAITWEHRTRQRLAHAHASGGSTPRVAELERILKDRQNVPLSSVPLASFGSPS